MKRVTSSTMFGVALIAFSALLLEVDITRVFAVTLWYYFGFVAISLALLGTGAAGVLCFLDPGRWTGDRHRHYMGLFSIALAVLCPLVMWFHLGSDFSSLSVNQLSFFLILGLQLVGFFLLFFCAGMVISIALFRYRNEIGRLYFFDLAGASLGSLAVMFLLYRWSAPALAFAVSAAAALAALVFLSPVVSSAKRILLALLLAASGAGLLSNDGLRILAVQTVKSYESHSVQATEERKIFEKWSPVSRVAVFEPQRISGKRERMRVTNDAGAPTTLHRFDGNWRDVDWVLQAPTNMGLQLRSDGDTLIIGSGGGMDVLSALRFGNRSITAVEINPVIAELGTRYYKDYIGNIFSDPRVTLHVQEGRNFAAGSPERYDLITITMIDSWAGAAAGAYMFSENTLYTYEAVRDYYTHLQDGGILSISRYYTWDEALRIVNTYLAYLNDTGVSNPEARILVVVEPARVYRRATLLLKKGEFTPAEIGKAGGVARDGRFTILYAPAVVESGELEPGPKADFFREVVRATPARRAVLLDTYRRDVSPSTDDRPFFFFMERFQDVFDPDLSHHPARRLALPILYVMFLVFAILAVLTVILPLWLRKDLRAHPIPDRTRIMLYFAGIGIGFMLIEISLIHRLTVFLGHPTYSFVVVLFTILLSSGIGSLATERWAADASGKRLMAVLGGIVALVTLVAVTIYDRLTNLMWLAFPARVAVSVTLLAPIGLLLGMCFPMGIRIARRAHDHLIPWAWAVNCVFSVFAAAASLVIAINFGLRTMMLAGAFCYLVNVVLLYGLNPAPARAA